MRMDEIDIPRPHPRANSACSANVPVGSHGNRCHRESRCARLLDKRRAGRADQELLMTLLAKTEREQENLALPASSGRAGVEMQNAEPLHSLVILSAKALKIPRSQGSGESFISSGCHCTPSTHQSSDFVSRPSTIPSGA